MNYENMTLSELKLLKKQLHIEREYYESLQLALKIL